MICEGCIKQDVCKFRNDVERFEEVVGAVGTCKYKVACPPPSYCDTTADWDAANEPWDTVTIIR